ncbi:MAG: DegV family protein [Anaerolineae bacterium]
MPLKIVTDSTCDLPPELVAAHSLTVVPLYINVGQQSFLDGVELSRTDFYTNLPGYSPPPTTAAPGPEQFRQVYQSLAEAGATEIISIHVSTALSNTANSARLAARQVSEASVTVLDSRQLSFGTGLLVLTAARLAAEGLGVADILPRLESQILRTHLAAALDTMEFLRRSGRVNGLVAGLGSILQIKPLLKMYNGQPDSERVRTRQRAEQRVLELLVEAAPLEQVALLHTNAPERAEQLRQAAAHLLPPGEVLSVTVTPVIGAHIGPGAVGFVAVTRK